LNRGQVEPQALFSEAVYVRCSDYVIAIATYVVDALVISKKQDDVGFDLTVFARGLICSTCTSLNSNRGSTQSHRFQKITPI
jgi:hypothetical protein